jgi:hypothetical protein
MLTLAFGMRGVVLHVVHGLAFMSPLLAVGGMNSSQIEGRAQDLDPVQYAISIGTVGTASDAIVAHLWRRRFTT